jgi:hypothetical protein
VPSWKPSWKGLEGSVLGVSFVPSQEEDHEFDQENFAGWMALKGVVARIVEDLVED